MFILQQIIRNFFTKKEFLDVLTPPMVSNPGMETHIHPFGVYRAINGEKTKSYLHTSPEFHMKNLLAEGFDKIFTLSYCFRDEPQSENHRSQFVMLEWYRNSSPYEEIMKDCEELLEYSLAELEKNNIKIKENLKSPLVKKSIQEIFIEVLDMDILEHLEVDSIRSWIQSHPEGIPLPEEKLSWDDY
ncbi:MAG: hypothetical protein KC493_02340, partial [Bacteriovoracaceae bacterium]|nr:hypothetical protein [Bacteriovoracaceae bacterium]